MPWIGLMPFSSQTKVRRSTSCTLMRFFSVSSSTCFCRAAICLFFLIARALEALGVGLGDLVEEALVLIDQHVFVSVAALTILPTVDCARPNCRAVAPWDLTLTSSNTR